MRTFLFLFSPTLAVGDRANGQCKINTKLMPVLKEREQKWLVIKITYCPAGLLKFLQDLVTFVLRFFESVSCIVHEYIVCLVSCFVSQLQRRVGNELLQKMETAVRPN